jgi:hypothetical protein
VSLGRTVLRRLCLAAVVFGFALLRFSGAAEPGAQPARGAERHFEDLARLLPAEPRAEAFDRKLTDLEHATGLRLVGRLFAKSPSAEEDAKAGAYMQALAQKLGTSKRGAFFAYFADEDDWRVWIGDESTSTFLGRPATSADLVEDGAFHAAKEAFLKQVHAKGEAEIAREKSRQAAGRVLPPGTAVGLQTAAMIDGLIDRLGGKRGE